MIVTCANCKTRFNLPDSKIPPGGAKVKCSKCAHVFKAELPPASPEEEVENLLDEETQAPDTKPGDEFDETFDEVAARGQEEAPVDGAADEEPAEEPVEEPVAEEAADEEPVAEPEAPADEPEAAEEAVEDDSVADDIFDDVADEIADEPVPEESVDDLFVDDADEPADEGDAGGGVDEAPDEDMPGMDDLFDDTDEAPESEEGPAPVGGDEDAASVADDVESLFGDDDEDDLFADDDEAPAEDDLFGDVGSDDDLGEDDELFASADTEEEDEDLEGDTDFGLDQEPEKKKPTKVIGCLVILLVAILGIGAAVYFKAWTLVGLDSESLKNVPYIGSMFMEETGDGEAAPGESPAERVRKIELRNVKQYYVANEKTGNLFVVEGKAINKFDSPKERIKVEVVLYDGNGNILTSKSFLCGNQLSQFQLQVQTQKEVEDGLASEVGILSNNTFIRPGGSTPFMAVFFQPPAGVKEFLVKVVDVGDPE